MKKVFKFFVAGPPDAGKTTFVKTISEIKPLLTDVRTTNRSTTVAFDFGLLKLDDRREIHVYGLPGQDRFSFIWEIVKKGALGYIYLVPAVGSDPMEITTNYLAIKKIAQLPHIVGVTKSDIAKTESAFIFQIAGALEILPEDIITVDPRKKIDVKRALEILFKKIIRFLSY